MRNTLRLAAGLCLVAASAWSQAGLGSISGTVVDPSDAAIPGATVTVVQLSTNSQRVTTTNEVGLFSLPSLVASRYSLTITAAGFKERKIDNLDLNAFQNLSLGRMPLDIGSGPAEVVTVTAEQQIIRENAVRFETIQARQVTEMPLQGRNWSTMLKIIPGSAPRNREAINGREASFDGYGDFRINGKLNTSTQVNLDGGSIVDHGSDAKTTVQPSLEGIQEMSVLTNNFQAEYGNRSGAVVNIITKSGTNEFHGTLFNYMRNEALNANSWSRTWDNLPRARYRFNYFGANLGGPIKKDKLFFFYNFEKPKQDTPTINRKVRVPTELERNGDFSQTINADGTRPIIYLPGTKNSGTPQLLPGNRIPTQLIHPVGRALMNMYPMPNYKDDTNSNYLYEYKRLSDKIVNTGKIDWNINDKTRAYFRYSEDYWDSQDRTTWVMDADLDFGVIRWQRPNRALAANVTRTWSSTLVSEQLFSWSYDYFNFDVDDLISPDKALRDKAGLTGLPSLFSSNSDIVPQVSGTGPFPGWHFNRFPMHALAHEYQGSSTWTLTKGSHIIKFGGQYIRNTKDEIDSSNEKGNFNFGRNGASAYDMDYEPANMLTGALSQFTQVSNQARKFSLYNDYHAFIQDTWRVTPTLTLDYGVRFYHVPSEYNTRPDITLDAAFFPSKWDPAKAPRFYVPDPKAPNRIIDPAYPNVQLPANMSDALRFSIVPGSGDLLNGVMPLNGMPGIRNPKWLLLAPRGGFAWSATPKTVLRGGFGWSYNRPTIGSAINRYENGLADQVDYRQTHIDVLTSSTVQRISPRNFGVIDESSNAMPVVYDYSLSIQRELPYNLVLDIAYVGNLQQHQSTDFNINQVLPGESWKPQYVDPRLAGRNFAGPVSASNPGPLPGSNAVDSNLMRPFQGFNTLTLQTNNANAIYNSLQTSVQKRFGHGLTFQFNHTYGYLRTQLENKGPFYYRWQDYTGFVADQDRRHVTAINYIYEVPKIADRFGIGNGFTRRLLDGWSIAHVLQFYSGRYFSPGLEIQEANTTTNVGLNSVFTGSPDMGPRIGVNGSPMATGGSMDAWYDVNGFFVPTIPDQGFGSRNYLRTPGTHSNDITVTKNIAITERRSIELRASIFNPFNMVRRDNVNGTVRFKAQGAKYSDGFYLFNTPQQQVDNLLSRRPDANAREIYNQYRGGAGHLNVTDIHPMRIIEIGLRFRF